MRVLVACEYSGTVRDAFLKLGHDAMSCDLLPTDVPGPHYQGDVFDVIEYPWDMAIFHLTVLHSCEYNTPSHCPGRSLLGRCIVMTTQTSPGAGARRGALLGGEHALAGPTDRLSASARRGAVPRPAGGVERPRRALDQPCQGPGPLRTLRRRDPQRASSALWRLDRLPRLRRRSVLPSPVRRILGGRNLRASGRDLRGLSLRWACARCRGRGRLDPASL